MTEQATETSVRRSVTVEASREHAFAVFTDGFGSWWPKTHHIGQTEPETVIVEPRAGGRCYEVGEGGVECDWGRVRAYEPPERFVLAWELNHEWKHDPSAATEVEVLFVEEGPGTTRVELEHRGFEVLGEHADEVRESVGSEGGWTLVLEGYARAARA